MSVKLVHCIFVWACVVLYDFYVFTCMYILHFKSNMENNVQFNLYYNIYMTVFFYIPNKLNYLKKRDYFLNVFSLLNKIMV